MRFIRSKNGEYSHLSGILEESIRQPLTGSCASQNAVISTPSTSEQVYAQMGQQIGYIDIWANNGYTMDTYHFVYEIETEEGTFALFYGEKVVKYIERRVTKREQNNLRGGLAHTSKIKDKPIEICDPIFFKYGERFMREDKPGKHYFNVSTTDEITNDLSMEAKVIEIGDLNSPRCSLIFKPEIVRSGQEKRCSAFFRAEIYRVSKFSTEIMIPSRPGWYNDEVFGWVFLERSRYKYLDNTNLPPAMWRRLVGRTDRTINEVFNELQPMIGQCLQKKVLWSIRLISPLLMPLWRHGVAVRTIIAAIIDNTNQMSASAAILKTGDFANFDTLSLYSSTSEIGKEIGGARDGVATFIGPLTATESKLNAAKVNYIRDSAIGANGTDKNARDIIAIIGRFIPIDLPLEFVLNIDCKGIDNDTDVYKLRNFVLEFDAAYISYIENHFDVVEGWISSAVEQYKAEPAPEIGNNKEGLYIALNALRKLMSSCFNIELFSEDEFKRVTNLFKESAAEIISPDYIVRDHFLDVTYNLLCNRKFIIMELKDAHKKYPGEGKFLILDRKKGFLNFPKEALDIIAQMIPTVKDGDELGAILKACNSIYCTDNGARQITISGRRPEFYSVYLSEFGDDILQIIRYIDNIEFFMLPEEVPENFIPLVWFRGRCAGIVLDGKGLPNPHINICGMSGMGKNRGAYRNGECFLRLRSKFIFINIKGPITEDSLNDTGCSTGKYDLFDLKTEGLPFDIFNVSGFKGKNAKVSYILNIICAAVNDLTDNQLNELSDYVNSMVGDDTQSFSLLELFEKFPKNRAIALQKKLTPLFNMMSAYTPKDINYKYSSCREFIDDCGRITVLSIVQSNITALRCTVYVLLQSVFEHQILDSHTRLVLYADEMQKYTSDSPFQQWFAEGRQYNIIAAGMTQEYRSRDNETRNFTSNAGIELFYPPTPVSANNVFKALNKGFSIEELCSGNLGDIIGKGFFWSSVEKRHKSAILCGKNDDDNFSKLKIRPKGYYGNVL